MMKQQRLFLEVRLERKSTWAAGRRHADLDFVGIEDALQRGLTEAGRQRDARRIAHSTLAGPKRRLHAALGRQLSRQGAGRRSLDELQGAIEVGLADAIGADEHGEPSRGE